VITCRVVAPASPPASSSAWRWLTPLTASALALAPSEADACKCSYDGPEFSGPRITGGEVRLQDESIALRCEPAPRARAACTWRARYQLVNTGPAGRLDLAIRHVPGAGVVLALDDVVGATTPAGPQDDRHRESTETRISWDAPSDGTVVLTVTADLLVAPWGCPCAPSPSKRRHPWVTRVGEDRYFVTYSPGGPYAAAPAQMAVDLDVPASWRLERDRNAVRHARRRRARELRMPATDEPYDPHGNLAFDRPLRLDPGGPVLAAGLGWGPEGLRPRLRAGWELAWPHMLVHSLVVETDAMHRVLVVPSLEPTFLGWPRFYPDLGAGLGVPVQVVPDPRAGVRVQARLGFFMVHLIGTFDHFPATHDLPVQRLGSLLLQMGF
jgi:hypothetical protein